MSFPSVGSRPKLASPSAFWRTLQRAITSAIGLWDAVAIRGADIVSASSINLTTATGPSLTLTGTTTVTAVTLAEGSIRLVRAAGAFQITASGSLLCNGSSSVNMSVSAEDLLLFRGGAGGVVSVVKIGASLTWERIATVTPSASAVQDFTGLSAFRELRLVGWLAPANDGVVAFARTSTDNGATFAASGSDYNYQVTRSTGATVTGNGGNDTGLTLGPSSTGNGTNKRASFVVTFHDFNKATQMRYDIVCSGTDSSGNDYGGAGGGRRLDTTARNALRVCFGAGNIASGYLVLEGIRG